MAASKEKSAELQRQDELDDQLLDTPEEEDKGRKSSGGAASVLCGGYYGVKSYLHNFYESRAYKDPELYENDEEELQFLLRPKRRRCTSIWWKVFVWIGANFLAFGIIGILVGYLVPQRAIVVGNVDDNVQVLDHDAIAFNFNLDVCKLVGLVLFCIGGLTLAVALLFPSFLSNYCDDDGVRESRTLRFHRSDDIPVAPCPPDKLAAVPATGQLSGVQPRRKQDEVETLVTIREEK